MEKNIDVGNNNNFIVKSINLLDNGKIFVHGVASTSRLDYQNEIVKVEGIDFQPFLREGYLNWHHKAKQSAGAIVGKPTEAYIEDGKLHVKGCFYKTDEAMKIYQLMVELEKEGDEYRRMGFSIEGVPLEHEDDAKTIISKMIMTGLALTLSPANDDTWAKVCKSFDSNNLKTKTINNMAKKKESPFSTTDELLDSFNRENGIPVKEKMVMKSEDGDEDDKEDMKKSDDGDADDAGEVKKGAGDDEHEGEVGNEIHLNISKEVLKAVTEMAKAFNEAKVEKATEEMNVMKAISDIAKAIEDIKKSVCKADSAEESDEEGSGTSKPIGGGVEKSVEAKTKQVAKSKEDDVMELLKVLRSEVATISKSTANAPKSVVSKAVPHPSEVIAKTTDTKVLKISDRYDKDAICDFISKSIVDPELKEMSVLSVLRGQELRQDVKAVVEDRFGVKITG